MLRKRKGLISSNDDGGPMEYTVNIVDCMLVLALGFMLFAIMSMNLQNVVFGNLSPEERAQIADAVKDTVQVERGEEVTESFENITGGSGDDYSQLGKVYEDPKTGKLYMVPD